MAHIREGAEQDDNDKDSIKVQKWDGITFGALFERVMQRFGRFEVEEQLIQGSMPWLSKRIWSFKEAKLLKS